MDNALFTVGCSLLSSIVVALISATVQFRNSKRQFIHEKRADLYSALYEHAEQLLHHRSLIFEPKFYNIMVGYNAKMKLMASKRAYKEFQNLGMYIHAQFFEYRKFGKNQNPHNDPNFYDEQFGASFVPEELEEIYLAELETYKKEHTPNREQLLPYVKKLLNAMQSDLGNN